MSSLDLISREAMTVKKVSARSNLLLPRIWRRIKESRIRKPQRRDSNSKFGLKLPEINQPETRQFSEAIGDQKSHLQVLLNRVNEDPDYSWKFIRSLQKVCQSLEEEVAAPPSSPVLHHHENFLFQGADCHLCHSDRINGVNPEIVKNSLTKPVEVPAEVTLDSSRSEPKYFIYGTKFKVRNSSQSNPRIPHERIGGHPKILEVYELTPLAVSGRVAERCQPDNWCP